MTNNDLILFCDVLADFITKSEHCAYCDIKYWSSEEQKYRCFCGFGCLTEEVRRTLENDKETVEKK